MKLPIHLPEPHSLNSPRFYALGLAFDGYMLLLAWLAQREGSRPWKLAIMPVGLWCLWELSGGVAWPDPAMRWFNYPWGLIWMAIFLTIPRLTLPAEPFKHTAPALVVSPTLDLLINPGAFRWKLPSSANYKPVEPSPPYRTAGGHAMVWVRSVFLMTCATALALPFPGLFDVKGMEHLNLGRDDIPFLPAFAQDLAHKRLVDLIVTACFGVCVYLFVEIAYHGPAAVAVAVGWRRESFPEIFRRPWMSESMHEFWGSRWHPLFGPIFGFYSSPFPKPLQLPVIFFISGLIHDLGLLPFTRNVISPRYITGFFFIQSVPIALERLFGQIMPMRTVRGKDGKENVVRRRVGGVWGRIWTIVWVLGTGQMFVEGVMRTGVTAYALRTVYRHLPWE